VADPVGIDEYITLRRASRLCGISSATLRVQANKGTLRAVRVGGGLLTTWRWLYEYLESRDAASRPTNPLPADYQAPE
jgi:hypothetical protein